MRVGCFGALSRYFSRCFSGSSNPNNEGGRPHNVNEERQHTQNDYHAEDQSAPSGGLPLEVSMNYQLQIADNSFQSRLQNWVKSAANPTENPYRLEAQRRILDAQKNNAETLDLSGLNLTRVPPLDELTNLKALNLSGNHLSTLPKECVKGLTSLQTLDLRNNHLTTIPEECFKGLTSLTFLDLSINKLTTIPEECFKGLTALQTLELTANQLTKLPNGCFAGLTALQTLDLSANQLTNLPKGCFAGLTSLEILNLNNNQLSTLSEKCIQELTALTFLDLGNNYLSTITEGCFKGLTSLKELDLSANQLTNLPKGCFAGLTSLEILNLNNNQLSTLSEKCIQELTALMFLDLNSNNLRTLSKGCFTGLTALQALDLRNNRLSSITKGCFKQLSALQVLHLNSNNLRTLSKGCFAGLTALQVLELNYNRLRTLPAGCLDNLTSLKTLDLAHNPLSTLPDGALSVEENLYLNDCTGLTSLPEWVFGLEAQCVDVTNTGIPVRLLQQYNSRQNAIGYSGPRIQFSILDYQPSDDAKADQLPQLVERITGTEASHSFWEYAAQQKSVGSLYTSFATFLTRLLNECPAGDKRQDDLKKLKQTLTPLFEKMEAEYDKNKPAISNCELINGVLNAAEMSVGTCIDKVKLGYVTMQLLARPGSENDQKTLGAIMKTVDDIGALRVIFDTKQKRFVHVATTILDGECDDLSKATAKYLLKLTDDSSIELTAEDMNLLHENNTYNMTKDNLTQHLVQLISNKSPDGTYIEIRIGDPVEDILLLAHQLLPSDLHKINMSYECCCALKDSQDGDLKRAALAYINNLS